MPLIVFGTILVDILPADAPPGPAAVGLVARCLGALWREVVAERWPASHWWFAINGVDRVVPDLRDVPQHQEHGAVRERRRLGRHDGRRRPVPLRRPRPRRGAARLVRHGPDGAPDVGGLRRLDRAGADLDRDRAGLDPAHQRGLVVRHRGRRRLVPRRTALPAAAVARADLRRAERVRRPPAHVQHHAAGGPVDRPGRRHGRPLGGWARCRRSPRSRPCTSAS